MSFPRMPARDALSALALAAFGFAAGLGQARADELKLRAVLNGGNVVSATDSEATGEATAVLDDDDKLVLNLVYGGLGSEVTGASLHIGKSNENGLSAMALDVRENQTVGSLVDAHFTLEASVAQRMRDGETYILVTTIGNPDGAIRGQLMPQPVRLADEPEE